MARRNISYKNVRYAFDRKSMDRRDQLALKDMFFDLLNGREHKSSPGGIKSKYDSPDNFTFFDNEHEMLNEMTSYDADFDKVSSYRMNGRKYWLAWTHFGEY